MRKFLTGCSESKEIAYFYAACQVLPVSCLDMCGLCPLPVCICVLCPGGHKPHDDPDGTHRSSGADPRYIADPIHSLGMQKRQVGDIICTPATPCEL